MASTSYKNLNDWRENFLSENVQAQEYYSDGNNFLSSDSAIIFSGPPYLKNVTDYTSLVPVGFVQGVQISQQKQIQQLFEIGARLPIFIPGRTFISASLNRILFDGPSLMYAIYLQQADGDSVKMNSWAVGAFDKGTGASIASPTEPSSNLKSTEESIDVTMESVKSGHTVPNPGYFFINLASSYFNKPIGLGFAFYDTSGDAYGGFYLEGCFIQAHSLSLAAQQTILVENISLRATALSPLEATGLLSVKV